MGNKVDIEDWERVRYRIDEEGMEYCFRQYSHWEEINDEKFHELRLRLINTMEEMREYVDKQIENYDE
jgi:predicted transcriptional regulator